MGIPTSKGYGKKQIILLKEIVKVSAPSQPLYVLTATLINPGVRIIQSPLHSAPHPLTSFTLLCLSLGTKLLPCQEGGGRGQTHRGEKALARKPGFLMV